MQISNINYNSRVSYTPFFKGDEDFKPIDVQPKTNQGGQHVKTMGPMKNSVIVDSTYSPSPKSKLKNHAVRNALLFTLAGAALGAVGTDNAIKHELRQDPTMMVSHLSGAPRELVEEWKILGLTVYPEIYTEAVVNNFDYYSVEQLSGIQSAQSQFADVYFNPVNNTFYAVLKTNASAGDIKAMFGINRSNDTSLESLNNMYRPTMGGDINTAQFKKGEIVRFSRDDAGYFN